MNPTAIQSKYLADGYLCAFYLALDSCSWLIGWQHRVCSGCQLPNDVALQRSRHHLLGFEGARGNAGGTLSIEGDVLHFQKPGKPVVGIKIASVRDVVLASKVSR